MTAIPPSDPPPPPTEGEPSIETVVGRAKVAASALLEADVMAFAIGLPELELARLKSKLRDAKVKFGDWAHLIGGKRKAIEQGRARQAHAENSPRTWREELWLDPFGNVRPTFGNLVLLLEHEGYADRLSFDEMAAVPCLDGRPVEDSDLNRLRLMLEHPGRVEFSRDRVVDAIDVISRRRSFHPVRQYLESLKWDGVRRIAKVAAEYLDATDSLSCKLVGRWFIGTVARALDPGCKMDTALVLQGEEGLKKSTFFRVLGGAWFRDSKVDITDRKGMMLMHSAWIYEWPEVDRMLERRHDSDVKAFITQQDDSFIPMYGRAPVSLKRSSVTVGTTNKDKFITSDTGSRRWWVVPVTKKIDADRLANQRDQLWAEAVALYKAYERAQVSARHGDANPFRWWLDDDEDSQRAERNEEHLTASPDVETVEAWLAGEPVQCSECRGTGNGHGRDAVGNPHPCPVCDGRRTITRGPLPMHNGREYATMGDVLCGALGIAINQQHELSAKRCSSVLRRLGWRAGTRIQPSGKKGPRVTPYYSPHHDLDAEAAAEERAAIQGEGQAVQE